MDMDIPLPEELELLESNSHLYEEHYPDFDPTEFSPQQPPPQPPPSPDLPFSFQAQTNNGRKRPPSDAPDDCSISEEKRVRVDNLAVAAETDDDEDWLCYSPPPPSEPVVAEQLVQEKTLSRFASEIDGEFMPITAPNGDRVYAKFNRFQREERLKKLDSIVHSADLRLEPINILLGRLEGEAFAKTLEASSECQSVPDVPETPVVHEQLWVDKYAPKSFTELLSDEQTNREVLLWLKQWDSIVFGSEIRSTSDDVLSALKRHSSIAQNHKPFDSKFSRKVNRGPKWSSGSYRTSRRTDEGDNSNSIQDIWNKKERHISPPEQKILMLCGPPGLGKTTLAHVAARHCGYHVVEVNASDDRSTSTIEAKILDVVQMNSVLSDSRPKCLVLDEIDGALGDGKGAVQVLLKMISAEKKSDGGKQNLGKEQLGRKSSKKGWKTTSLSRPVICICNDLYAPALRPLRHIAKVHIFVQPTVSRVVNRLKYICNMEGTKASAIALTALAEYTDCDIRSCLNTLQFLIKKKETLNMFDVGSQVVGQKDMSKNVLDVWKAIFQRKRTKMEKSHKSVSFDFDFLYSLIANRGDYDLILDGIHENILQFSYHDPMMQKTVKCFNSFGNFDLVRQYIMRTQQMILQVYMPPMAITIHNLVAQVQNPNIEWPKSYHRYRTMMIEKMDILNTWHYKVPPHIARHLSASSFVEDLISPLLQILSPPTIRPVALQLLSDKDKNDLAQLVSTMVSYSITYKSMKSDMLPNNLRHEAVDDLAMSFVPPIRDFINFKDYTSNHNVLSLAMKQVLVHEIEKQKILQVNTDRRMAVANDANEIIEVGTNKSELVNTSHAAAVAVKNIEYKNNRTVWPRSANPTTVSPNLNHDKGATDNSKLQKTGKVKKPSRSSSSFFDRFKKFNAKGFQSNDGVVQKEATLEKDRSPLFFKFHEGFTNAVKRPVRIREFLS